MPGSPSTPPPVPDVPLEGVRALDHTADVGLELRAPSLEILLARAVRGMDWLLREAAPPDPEVERMLEVEAPDAPSLLRNALREVLAWHDLEGLAPAEVRVRQVRREEGGGARPLRLEAAVAVGRPAADPVREIKGVTLHGLAAEPAEEGWRGRVIFDV